VTTTEARALLRSWSLIAPVAVQTGGSESRRRFDSMFEQWDPGPVPGGMTPGRGPSLADRVRPHAPAEAEAQHCWVTDAPSHPGRYPGLLLEWRRTGSDWAGLVSYAMPEVEGIGCRLVQRWVPARCLTPANFG
jgi:hypothetical protein